MKKVLSVLLSFILFLGSVAAGGDGFVEVFDAFIIKASAKTIIILEPLPGFDSDWTLDDEGTLIISGTVMDYLNGNYSGPWCSRSSSIKTVVIENGVTSIGKYAFYGCSALTSITIPDSVISIDDYAFSMCSGLTSITIPNSVANIGRRAFDGCGLTSITLGNGVTSIGYETFYGCTGLTSITIPDSVTSIGNDAFHGCTALTSITIPDSVTSINDYVFSYCSSLTSITIPSSITSIGVGAFYCCSALKSITIPNSVTSIKGYAFNGCSTLTSITISDSVTSIGDYAFCNCTALTSITIPDSVTNISICTFSNCTSLTSITIPDGITSIGSSAFYDCSGLTSITIPDSVTGIGEQAFYGCKSLESITLPSKTVLIGHDAFYFGTQLRCYKNSTAHVYAEENNRAFYLIDGTEEENTISGKIGLKLTWRIDRYTRTLEINNDGAMVAFIANEAPWLNYNQYILHAVINEGCSNISANAFKQLSYLQDVVLPSSITSIGNDAFRSCTALTSITIPDSVTSIGEDAFFGCTGLTSITIPNGIASISRYTFSNCTSLTSITIPDSVTSIGNSAFYVCSALTSITIPDSVTSIGSSAFQYCFGLTSITIPDSVTSIGSSAFYDCSALTSVTIGNGCGELSGGLFSGCSNLENVVLSYGVSSISSGVFSGCNSLNTITIYNRECYINETAIPIYATIYGFTGSTAESFAENYGYGFVPIDGTHEHVYDNPCDDRCNLCNEKRITAHNYGEWEVTQESTCIIHGIKARTCSICNGVEEERLPLAGHNYGDWVEEKEPTCSENGIRAIYCLICGNKVTESIDKIAHTYDDDCDEYCNVCNASRPVSHTDNDDNGLCDLCGAQVYFIKSGQSKVFNANGQEMIYLTFIPEDSGIYTFSSSADKNTYGCICDENKNTIKSGYGYYDFNIQYTFTEGVTYYLGFRYSSSGSSGDITVSLVCNQLSCKHTDVTEYPESPATCKETGYTAGVYCNICEQWVSGHEFIPLTAHTYDDACDPTCNVCGLIRSTQHQYGEYTVTVAPNCGNEGREVATCAICGATKARTIPAQGSHSFGEWRVYENSTCIKQGTERRHCTICGTYQERNLDFAEHNYKPTVIEPTCSEIGYTVYTCKVCGERYTAAILKPVNHTDEDSDGICDICGETSGCIHDYTVDLTDATCTEAGKIALTCKKCGFKAESEIEAKGHNYIDFVTEPTCTKDGFTRHICSYCGDEYTDGTKPALGHSIRKEVVTPTCTENGCDLYICSVCGYNYFENEIPAAGHIRNAPVKENAVYSSAGDETSYDSVVYCKTCGQEISRERVDITDKLKINNYRSSFTADYKSTVILHTTIDAPSGYKIIWSNGQEGSECKFTATEKEYKISAKLVNVSTGGTVQMTDEVTITVNTGFFAKLVAFFKGLFRKLPTYIDFKKK